MRYANLIRLLIAVILAGMVDDFIHLHVGIHAPSYGLFIDTVSYITKPLEALGVAILYYLIGDRFPTKSRLIHGVLLGMLILLIEGQLIRQPLMNILLHNPVKEVFLRQGQVWLAHFAMALIITLIIKPRHKSF